MMRYELIHGVLLGSMVVLATTFVTEERRRFLFESLTSEGASHGMYDGRSIVLGTGLMLCKSQWKELLNTASSQLQDRSCWDAREPTVSGGGAVSLGCGRQPALRRSKPNGAACRHLIGWIVRSIKHPSPRERSRRAVIASDCSKGGSSAVLVQLERRAYTRGATWFVLARHLRAVRRLRCSTAALRAPRDHAPCHLGVRWLKCQGSLFVPTSCSMV